MAVVDMDHDDSTALLHVLGASNTLTAQRDAGPRAHSPRRPQDEAQGVRSWRRRHPDHAVLAGGAAGAIHRHHSPRDRDSIARSCRRSSSGRSKIDILNRQVLAGESVVHLSGIEQSLLYLLASRGGQVVTRDEILDAIWGTDFVAESNIVDRHVRSLRIKLQNDYRHPRFIATVPGVGYRFIPTFSLMISGSAGSDPRRPSGGPRRGREPARGHRRASDPEYGTIRRAIPP